MYSSSVDGVSSYLVHPCAIEIKLFDSSKLNHVDVPFRKAPRAPQLVFRLQRIRGLVHGLHEKAELLSSTVTKHWGAWSLSHIISSINNFNSSFLAVHTPENVPRHLRKLIHVELRFFHKVQRDDPKQERATVLHQKFVLNSPRVAYEQSRLKKWKNKMFSVLQAHIRGRWVRITLRITKSNTKYRRTLETLIPVLPHLTHKMEVFDAGTPQSTVPVRMKAFSDFTLYRGITPVLEQFGLVGFRPIDDSVVKVISPITRVMMRNGTISGSITGSSAARLTNVQQITKAVLGKDREIEIGPDCQWKRAKQYYMRLVGRKLQLFSDEGYNHCDVEVFLGGSREGTESGISSFNTVHVETHSYVARNGEGTFGTILWPVHVLSSVNRSQFVMQSNTVVWLYDLWRRKKVGDGAAKLHNAIQSMITSYKMKNGPSVALSTAILVEKMLRKRDAKVQEERELQLRFGQRLPTERRRSKLFQFHQELLATEKTCLRLIETWVGKQEKLSTIRQNREWNWHTSGQLEEINDSVDDETEKTGTVHTKSSQSGSDGTLQETSNNDCSAESHFIADADVKVIEYSYRRATSAMTALGIGVKYSFNFPTDEPFLLQLRSECIRSAVAHRQLQCARKKLEVTCRALAQNENDAAKLIGSAIRSKLLLRYLKLAVVQRRRCRVRFLASRRAFRSRLQVRWLKREKERKARQNYSASVITCFIDRHIKRYSRKLEAVHTIQRCMKKYWSRQRFHQVLQVKHERERKAREYYKVIARKRMVWCIQQWTIFVKQQQKFRLNFSKIMKGISSRRLQRVARSLISWKQWYIRECVLAPGKLHPLLYERVKEFESDINVHSLIEGVNNDFCLRLDEICIRGENENIELENACPALRSALQQYWEQKQVRGNNTRTLNGQEAGVLPLLLIHTYDFVGHEPRLPCDNLEQRYQTSSNRAPANHRGWYESLKVTTSNTLHPELALVLIQWGRYPIIRVQFDDTSQYLLSHFWMFVGALNHNYWSYHTAKARFEAGKRMTMERKLLQQFLIQDAGSYTKLIQKKHAEDSFLEFLFRWRTRRELCARCSAQLMMKHMDDQVDQHEKKLIRTTGRKRSGKKNKGGSRRCPQCKLPLLVYERKVRNDPESSLAALAQPIDWFVYHASWVCQLDDLVDQFLSREVELPVEHQPTVLEQTMMPWWRILERCLCSFPGQPSVCHNSEIMNGIWWKAVEGSRKWAVRLRQAGYVSVRQLQEGVIFHDLDLQADWKLPKSLASRLVDWLQCLHDIEKHL